MVQRHTGQGASVGMGWKAQVGNMHTVQAAPADKGRSRWRRKDPVLPDDHLLDPVAGCQLEDDLRGLLVEVAPITTQSDGLANHLIAQ